MLKITRLTHDSDLKFTLFLLRLPSLEFLDQKCVSSETTTSENTSFTQSDSSFLPSPIEQWTRTELESEFLQMQEQLQQTQTAK